MSHLHTPVPLGWSLRLPELPLPHVGLGDSGRRAVPAGREPPSSPSEEVGSQHRVPLASPAPISARGKSKSRVTGHSKNVEVRLEVRASDPSLMSQMGRLRSREELWFVQGRPVCPWSYHGDSPALPTLTSEICALVSPSEHRPGEGGSEASGDHECTGGTSGGGLGEWRGVSGTPRGGYQPPLDHRGLWICQACLNAAIVPAPGK